MARRDEITSHAFHVTACLTSVAILACSLAWTNELTCLIDGPGQTDLQNSQDDDWSSQDNDWSRQLANWGSDHIGRPAPEYLTGDECLFCHRSIGSSWQKNPHQTTLRLADTGQTEIQSLARRAPGEAEEVEFLLGTERLVRYLKRSRAYGRMDMLSVAYRPYGRSPEDGSGELLNLCNEISWDGKLFGERCIGCHTTAVDSQRQTFAATSLDCIVCHGEVILEHTTDVSKVLLSRHPQDPFVVNSICCSCHLRGGNSQTTGLPYPNSFVPGDNLFRDFRVDLTDSAISSLPAMQQHIYLSARLAGSGAKEPTCTDCHSVHGLHSDQHIELRESQICNSCHVANSGGLELTEMIRQYELLSVRNATCDY